MVHRSRDQVSDTFIAYCLLVVTTLMMVRGKTLEQMDQVFHTHTAQADMKAKQDIFDVILPAGFARSATLVAGDSNNEKLGKASEDRIEHKV